MDLSDETVASPGNIFDALRFPQNFPETEYVLAQIAFLYERVGPDRFQQIVLFYDLRRIFHKHQKSSEHLRRERYCLPIFPQQAFGRVDPERAEFVEALWNVAPERTNCFLSPS